MTKKIQTPIKPDAVFDFRVIFGGPTLEDLNHCDLWCMYICPDELGELEQWGYPRDFLLEKLVQPLSTSNDHPVYPIPEGRAYMPREYVYLKVEVECDELGKGVFDGFATFIDGDLRSVNTFWKSEPLMFLLYPMEAVWNTDSFKAITGREPDLPFVEFRISAGRIIPWAVLPTMVQIPMVETEDEELPT